MIPALQLAALRRRTPDSIAPDGSPLMFIPVPPSFQGQADPACRILSSAGGHPIHLGDDSHRAKPDPGDTSHITPAGVRTIAALGADARDDLADHNSDLNRFFHGEHNVR